MVNSRQLAGLVGPTLVVLSLSEAKNLHIWAVNDAPVTYLSGLLWFAAGLALVRAHNVWVRAWPVLITLTGWLVLFLGLFRAFFPEAQHGLETTPAFAVYAIDAALLASGLWLTATAYGGST